MQDYFCLGAYESYPDLCAPALEFCAITDPSAMPVVFENINGLIGFAPVPSGNLDIERQSFIYGTNNTVDRASWNFNFEPTPSTLRLGGKDLEDANGGFLTLQSSTEGLASRYWTMMIQSVNYGTEVLSNEPIISVIETVSPMTYIPRAGWTGLSEKFEA